MDRWERQTSKINANNVRLQTISNSKSILDFDFASHVPFRMKPGTPNGQRNELNEKLHELLNAPVLGALLVVNVNVAPSNSPHSQKCPHIFWSENLPPYYWTMAEQLSSIVFGLSFQRHLTRHILLWCWRHNIDSSQMFVAHFRQCIVDDLNLTHK